MAAAAANKGGFDTIYALSSGRPPAAIAVVRISGPEAAATLRALAGRVPVPRTACLARLRDAAGATLDHGLTLWFPGPASATGEDLAELHLHGGRAVVDAVLRTLAARGLRMAEPGEFTRRALIHGRLDLAEVEGLGDLLSAETEIQRVEALRRAEGQLGRALRGLADALVALAAMIEARIDYEEAQALDGVETDGALHALSARLDALLAAPPVERLREGVRIAIAGPPNAGKSSLFNALLANDAAIVSPIAGTTRDVLERPVAIAGIPCLLLDTAGLREAEDAVERIGIERARAALASADLILDLAETVPESAARIAVQGKADLVPPIAGRLAVSSRTGSGLDTLLQTIASRAAALLPGPDQIGLEARYRVALETVRGALDAARATSDLVLQAEHVRVARETLNRLTGGADIEAMLDALFGRFCLGK
ncbi:tRNA uridine-5-carboxymethylaminomethyl(34) synthesis GTPase MnmE [Sphingomonas morindae]|uniref:tRNA modification GTPase MnmE n=1 Tax=Sphingomonas morindae TaxID=1541170 RepID=A0ABY4XBE4_9SPHN|nr:tRNA uridine-5-carboxymethylaminomethyl(34) synthesis GTPase MnmE [Sphingomonas morindae]USI74297.1 tRNA uridine-5-carboxymethylaminomethyl(34) synthesis GTPase MnmE [Sphingomonas morindae]